MPELGLTYAECLDFDFAVRGLKRWADIRSEEQTLEPDDMSEAERKRRSKMRPVPKYRTLDEVLGLTVAEGEHVPAAEVADLARAMAQLDTGWQGFGGLDGI